MALATPARYGGPAPRGQGLICDTRSRQGRVHRDRNRPKRQPGFYIGGPRGAIERNAVRYYLAIQAFMSTLRYPAESRFGKRIGEWYDLTGRYTKQLFDLDTQDDLEFKTAEHENQMALQRSPGTGLR